MSLVKEQDSCWIWKRPPAKHGYGQIVVKGIYYLAHRLSYLLHKGPLEKGKLVCHTCDVKVCVNPDHLYLGTISDNANDAYKRGQRIRRQGELATNVAKLTAENVKFIRESLERTCDLAKQFNVHQTTISKIKTKASWKHL